MTTLLTRRDPTMGNGARLFDRFFSDPFFNNFGTELASPMLEEGTLALDVSEDADNVIVRASLPGFRREDIDLEIHDSVLTIKAERREESESSGEQFFRRERRFGAVSRRVALPSMVDEKNANATLQEGVLTLRLPKTEEARPKKISIG